MALFWSFFRGIRLLLLLLLVVFVGVSWHVVEALLASPTLFEHHSPSLLLHYNNNNEARYRMRQIAMSSFFGNFEDDDYEEEDEDDEDDDDDEYDEVDDRALADFRTRMSSLFGDDESSDEDKATTSSSEVDELISFATAKSDTPKDWAKQVEHVSAGCLLLANPAHFCSDFDDSSSKGRGTVSPQLLAKFGLTLPPPSDLGPDRRADLLPVLMVTKHDDDSSSSLAVLLNRRTGYLLGDLEQSSETPAPVLEKFCIQPLWFGGIDNVSTGLEMLHLCPAVKDATALTEDGLYFGGDPSQAQEAMDDSSNERVFTGFDFKFFVQSTRFGPGELQKYIDQGTFFCASVSKEVLFKSRDRMGTRRAKPLWTEVMELLGGKYLNIKARLYGDDDDDDEQEQDYS